MCGVCQLYSSIQFEQAGVSDNHKEVSFECIHLYMKLTRSIDHFEHFFSVCASIGGLLHVLAELLLFYYQQIIKIRMKQWIVGLAFLLIIVASNSEERGSGVALLSANSLSTTLEENSQVVLYFWQEDCLPCAQFSQTFVLISKLHSSVAHFSKLALDTDSSSLFQQYQVDSTPTVLAFSEGQLLPFRFQPTGSGTTVSIQFFKWIERLFLPLKQWDQDDSRSHQLIVHCHTQQFTDFWRDISRNQLWLDVYCGSEDMLSQNLVIVHEYGRRVEAWQLQNDFQQVSAKLRHLIKSYKYKYVLNWSTALAQQVFRYNVSAFILITNNDSISRQLVGRYQQIKKEWYQNSHNYQPTIFAISDLSLHPAETLKLKRYLTGYSTFAIKDYYYPIIGFFQSTQKKAKYLVNLTSNKNNTVLEQFIDDVNTHLIKGMPYDEEEKQLVQWLNQDDQPVSPEKVKSGQVEQKADEKKVNKEKITKIMTQKNWQQLLTSYNKPFFVYFTWRYGYKFNLLEWQFTNWWEGQQPIFAPQRQAYDIFIHIHNFMDLPIFQELTVQYFPSFYYFSSKKDIVKLEGVTELDKIKSFINEAYARKDQ